MIKKLFGFFIGLFLLISTGLSANFYVRPTSTGLANGSDWNDAWSSINWNSVNGGDTVWLAGGNYSTPLHITKSGTAGNPIYIKRVRSTDSIPVSAAGWNSSFDSQVVINPNGPPLYYDTPNVGSYMNIDGRIDSGIKLMIANVGGIYPGAIYFADGSGGQHDIIFTNLDLAGPGGNSTFSAAIAPFSVRTWNGSSFTGISNIVVASTRIHGGPDLILLCNAKYVTFDGCKLYDNDAANSASFHPNVVEYLSSGYITFKNCDFSGWTTEGIMPYGNSTGPLYIYNCVWHDPGLPYPRIVEVFTPTQVFFYNNTIVNVNFSILNTATGGSYSAGSQAYNNIIWNSAGMGGISDANYNFTDGTIGGANSISGGSNPFVNLAGKDYHIIPTIGTKLPAGKGKNLSTVFNIDKDGNIRGTIWDIGAYSSSTNNTQTISAPQNITDIVNTNSVTLAWNRNPETNVTGYIIHYGSASGTYTNSLDVGNNITGTISNLQSGITYYFMVTAYNDIGLNSLPSNEISYQVPSVIKKPAKITNLQVTLTTISTNQPPSSPVPDILWYKFNEGTGLNLIDSANTNNGTISNAGMWTTGKNGGAIIGNGSSWFVKTINNINYNTNVISISMWIFANNWLTSTAVWAETDINGYGTPNAAFILDNELGTRVFGGLHSVNYLNRYMNIPSTGVWHHVVFIIDNSTSAGNIRILLDGIEQSTIATDTSKSGTNNFASTPLFLLSRGGTTFFNNIKIDDFRIYSGILTSNQIQQIMSNPQ